MGYKDELEAAASHPAWQILEVDGPSKDQTVYSSSRISKMGDCLWDYYLEWEKRSTSTFRSVPLTVGDILHKTISFMHANNAMDRGPEVLDSMWRQIVDDDSVPWFETNYRNMLIGEYRDAQEIIAAYVQKEGKANVVAVEPRFFMSLQHPRTKNRYRITGKVDQIRKVLGGYAIYDLKRWAQEPDEAFLANAYQFTIYGLALKHAIFDIAGDLVTFDEYPVASKWVHLKNLVPYKRKSTKKGKTYNAGDSRGPHVLDVFRSELDYERAVPEIFRLIQMVRMGLFARQPGPTKCKMCRNKTLCMDGYAAPRLSLTNMTDSEVFDEV